jgi:hypothetical protein
VDAGCHVEGEHQYTQDQQGVLDFAQPEHSDLPKGVRPSTGQRKHLASTRAEPSTRFLS